MRTAACGPAIFVLGKHRLEADDIQRLLGDQLLQLVVLRFQLPQSLRVTDLQTSILCLTDRTSAG
jgi:hypothetical protein